MSNQTTKSALDITHNQAANRFETTVDGQTGYISYQDRDDTLVYDHTIVPRQLGGQGVGSALVKHALDYAREHDKRLCRNARLWPHISASTLSTKIWYSLPPFIPNNWYAAILD
ncbi:hypothetical protein PKHYL_02100 [Psychrobacter sp. KH172YL61]|nr:hypothetical protein PKHYL_02100 [Psychrobacter sp. KH172YL61]